MPLLKMGKRSSTPSTSHDIALTGWWYWGPNKVPTVQLDMLHRCIKYCKDKEAKGAVAMAQPGNDASAIAGRESQHQLS